MAINGYKVNEVLQYIKADRSLQFPSFPIAHLIPQYIEQSKTAGRNVAMKAFRAWVRSQI
jgi:hypothetical protein